MFFVVVLLFVLFTIPALAQNENWPNKIRIGTASIGGGFYMGGSSIANVLKELFPEKEIVVEQTKASVHNIKLAQAADIEIGMATTDTTYEAWYGKGPFEGEEYRGFRLLMPAWPVPYMFVTKGEENSVKDFTQKWSAITKGSATDVFTRKAFGLFEVKSNIINLTVGDSAQALKNGTIQGFSIGHPNTAVKDLAMSAKVNIFGLMNGEAEEFMKAHPEFTYPLTIEAGSYKGQDEDLTVVGMYDVVVVNKDLPDDFVYTILKAMYDHIDIVEATWPAMAKGMSYENIDLLGVPLHPGAIKYYKEVGVDIPEKLLASE